MSIWEHGKIFCDTLIALKGHRFAQLGALHLGPIPKHLPSTFGRGAGGEGSCAINSMKPGTFCHTALTLTLSQRERGLCF
jgi:hypothetical protein